MDPSLLEELQAADAQGERALYTLWPGDSFLYQGEFHEVTSMQLVPPQDISIKTKAGRHFLLRGMLVFPALLTDQHAEAERNDEEVW